MDEFPEITWSEISWDDDADFQWDSVVFVDPLPIDELSFVADELGITIEELEELGRVDFYNADNTRGTFVSAEDAFDYADEIPVPTEILYNDEDDYYFVHILYDTVYG